MRNRVKECNKYDEDILKEFLLTSGEVTQAQMTEVRKVIFVVWVKHFSNYLVDGEHLSKDDRDDLENYALLSLLIVRGKPNGYQEWIPDLDSNKVQKINPDGSPKFRRSIPSNYIYTKCRNEIGNKLNKFYKKESTVSDINALREGLIDTTAAELPQEIEKFKSFLLGLESYNYIRISKVDALNLILFMRLYDTKDIRVPEFLLVSDKSAKKKIMAMYKLLMETFQ